MRKLKQTPSRHLAALQLLAVLSSQCSALPHTAHNSLSAGAADIPAHDPRCLSPSKLPSAASLRAPGRSGTQQIERHTQRGRRIPTPRPAAQYKQTRHSTDARFRADGGGRPDALGAAQLPRHRRPNRAGRAADAARWSAPAGCNEGSSGAMCCDRSMGASHSERVVRGGQVALAWAALLQLRACVRPLARV